MAEDIARLGLKIDSKDILKAIKRLDKLENQSKKTERQSKKLGSSFGALKGAIAGIAFGVAIRGIINTAAAFEKLEASLVTVTGSTEKAVMAMEGIKAFATETPFQVQEITDAFIKLKALGIAPTEENLRSFGNTASAMGRSLNQMIEAVADAATGEFERLKEFGIKSSVAGDKVKFTFQGITTEVGKNSAEITKFLEGIGETQFAGAMEKQMDTLDGAFSNFSDTVDNAVSKLSKESGFNELIKSATSGVALFIRELAGTETIDDFNVKIDETNELIKVWNERLKDAEKAKEGAFFGGFFTSGAIQTANTQLEMLNKRLLELQLSVKEAESASGGIAGAGGRTAEERAALAQAEADKLFEIETDKLMLQIDLDDQKLEQQLTFNEQRLVNEMDYYDRLFNLQAGSQQAAFDFTNALRDNDIKGAIKHGSLMLSNLGKTNRAIFEVQKAAATANAIVATHDAVMSSWKNAGGYPWGIIPAGLMLAQGLSQVSAIQSTSFGSKSASGGGIGGSSTSPSAPVASGLPPGSTAVPDGAEVPTQQVSITLNGAGYSRDDVRELIDSINEEIGDGATLVAA